MNEITIELNQSDFAGGETVQGQVVVRLDEDTPLRGIRLLLRGFEMASWREGSGKHRHTHSDTCEFFKEEITLEGRPRLGLGELVVDSLKGVFSKEGYETLRAGTYNYPFTYILPPNLPGNYESTVTGSQIYYGLKAKADLPLRFDLKCEQRLIIREPASPVPVQAMTQRQTKKFLFDSDSSIEATIHLDKNTFCLGETLLCRLEVMNLAFRKEIRAVALALRQIETAFADGRTHKETTEVTQVRFEECRFPLKERTAMILKLGIPRDLNPTIARASLLKLDYELLVTLDIPWAVDVKLSAPVVLVRSPVG